MRWDNNLSHKNSNYINVNRTGLRTGSFGIMLVGYTQVLEDQPGSVATTPRVINSGQIQCRISVVLSQLLATYKQLVRMVEWNVRRMYQFGRCLEEFNATRQKLERDQLLGSRPCRAEEVHRCLMLQ